MNKTGFRAVRENRKRDFQIQRYNCHKKNIELHAQQRAHASNLMRADNRALTMNELRESGFQRPMVDHINYSVYTHT